MIQLRFGPIHGYLEEPREDRSTDVDVILWVPNLINQLTEQWNSDLVLYLLGEEDAKYILEIPVRSAMEDHSAWHYNVKWGILGQSAHHLGVVIRDAKPGEM
jgi:hypothetical protein